MNRATAKHVIEQRLLRRHPSDLEQQRKVPAVALRLIVCGDEFAGKTTLSSSLAEACSKRVFVKQKGKVISEWLGIARSVDRTCGIELHNIEEDGIHISLWDMAGQREFQAFHDYMFQGSSSDQDSHPALVMFVWSPVASKNEENGADKHKEDFHNSLSYWLEFVASSTRQSDVARKVIVAVTRKDQRRHVEQLVGEEIEALREKFKGIVEIDEAVQVDARSSSSVKPLAARIFRAAKVVLHSVETYAICRKVKRHLSSSLRSRNVFKDRPIIEWGDFEKYLEEKFRINSRDMQKAIASSLNDSGDLIHLGNMLILDTGWFCRDMVVKLIHFPESVPQLPPNFIPIKGFERITYAASMLESLTEKKVAGSQLVQLMEAMHLSCKDPKDPQRVCIPSTLFTPSSTRLVSPLKWSRSMHGPATYLGRRLECDRKDLTVFSLGLFPTLQVLFYSLFGKNDERETDIKLDRDIMSILIGDMEIILECGHNVNGERVIIDVMAQGPYNASDTGKTLITYVENEIIQTIIRVCKEPAAENGQGGVKLVEGVIHPDSLVHPDSLRQREDRCVSIQDLKQQLRRQLEEETSQQKLVYEWKGKRRQPFVDLLGVKAVEDVLLLYKKSLISAYEEASRLVCKPNDHEVVRSVGDPSNTTSTTTPADDKTEEIETGESSAEFSPDASDHEDMKENLTDENGAQQYSPVARRTRCVVSSNIFQYIDVKFDNFYTKVLNEIKAAVESGINEGIQQKLDEVLQMQSSVLPRIVSVVEQTLYFAVGQAEGKLPRLIYLTTDDGKKKKKGTRRKIVTSVFKGLESVHIELFCECRECPHRVEEQEGLWVTTIKDGKLKKALPWINDLLKLLTLVAKVGAHVLAGASSVIGDIPDLASLIAYALDTPSLLEYNEGLQRACSSKEALVGWQEWLSSVLLQEQRGGPSDATIARYFQLRRAIYCDTSHVAWLCPNHFPAAPNYSFIKPYPLLFS